MKLLNDCAACPNVTSLAMLTGSDMNVGTIYVERKQLPSCPRRGVSRFG